MASVQQAHDTNQLSDKEKAAIEEAMKEAESSFLARKNNNKNSKGLSEDKSVYVTGILKNLYPEYIYLDSCGDYAPWRGWFWDEPPNKIDVNGIGAFAFRAVKDFPRSVCKSKIVFSSKSNPSLGWLLAWDKRDKINQVYVEAGTLDRLKEMSDFAIENKLYQSGNISRYWDSDTGASAAAEIREHDDYTAFIVATFDQFHGIPQQS
ncbi:uncharacterized protein [Spinacia oleracea]|uniref:Uncharacterized protein isoform X1 n=1 Tax=Spinacia oleracea TaxID=3562 RepID=A0A9R0JQY8_SPIOL|nr:uncharacterized protein LOC110783360 isoform X1 [Spinacia oleracea]